MVEKLEKNDRYEKLMRMIRPEWKDLTDEQMSLYYIWLRSEIIAWGKEHNRRKADQLNKPDNQRPIA